MKVELAWLDAQQIPGWGCEETLLAAGAEHLAEARDLHPQRMIRRPGLPIARQLLDQPVPRDDFVRAQKEKRKERSLPRTANTKRSTVDEDLERAQDAEVDTVAAHGRLRRSVLQNRLSAKR
jgi:hypothetical protein